MNETAEEKNITVNRKAEHEYFIVQRIEAGIVLVGTEVKSLRENKVNLSDAYAAIRDGEVWLINAHISEYKQGNILNHEPLRKRKLLLNKREIRKLKTKIEERGFTLIPLRLYIRKGKIKVEVGVAKGKRKYDKREAIARKDRQREVDRNFNTKYRRKI